MNETLWFAHLTSSLVEKHGNKPCLPCDIWLKASQLLLCSQVIVFSLLLHCVEVVRESPRLYVPQHPQAYEAFSLPSSTLAQVTSMTQDQPKQPVHLVTPTKAILQAQLLPYNFLCLWYSPPLRLKLPRKGECVYQLVIFQQIQAGALEPGHRRDQQSTQPARQASMKLHISTVFISCK